MNKKAFAPSLDGRDRIPTPSRIFECGRRTTMTLDDRPTFDPRSGLRTVAFLAAHFDAHGRLTDLAAIAAVCSDEGVVIDQLGELLVGLPPDACPGSTPDHEASWRTTLGAALQVVDLVVAHDAWVQREAIEAIHGGFARLDWACSRQEVDWRRLGFPADRLPHIGAHLGLQPRGERAVDRCHLLLSSLTRWGQHDRRLPLAQLLTSVDAPTVRLFTGDLPAAHVPTLQRRGYRWSPGQDGAPEGFFIDRSSDVAQVERRFLARLLGREEGDVLECPLPAEQRYRLP